MIRSIKFNYVATMNAIEVAIDVYGFVSQKEANAHGIHSTADRVRERMAQEKSEGREYRNHALSSHVMDVVDWLKNKPGKQSKFIQDVRSVIQIAEGSGYVLGSSIAWIAPIFKFHADDMIAIKDRADRAVLGDGDFIGELKKRGEFFVKLIKTRNINGVANNPSTIWEVVDRAGNCGMFFSAQDADIGVAFGDCFLMKATPVGHMFNDFKLQNETRFNRIKVLQNMGAAK
jgi:hypothetical protein